MFSRIPITVSLYVVSHECQSGIDSWYCNHVKIDIDIEIDSSQLQLIDKQLILISIDMNIDIDIEIANGK